MYHVTTRWNIRTPDGLKASARNSKAMLPHSLHTTLKVEQPLHSKLLDGICNKFEDTAD